MRREQRRDGPVDGRHRCASGLALAREVRPLRLATGRQRRHDVADERGKRTGGDVLRDRAQGGFTETLHSVFIDEAQQP